MEKKSSEGMLTRVVATNLGLEADVMSFVLWKRPQKVSKKNLSKAKRNSLSPRLGVQDISPNVEAVVYGAEDAGLIMPLKAPLSFWLRIITIFAAMQYFQ